MDELAKYNWNKLHELLPFRVSVPPVLELPYTLSSPSVSGGVLLKLSPIGDSLREPRPISASGSVLIGSVGLLGT